MNASLLATVVLAAAVSAGCVDEVGQREAAHREQEAMGLNADIPASGAPTTTSTTR